MINYEKDKLGYIFAKYMASSPSIFEKIWIFILLFIMLINIVSIYKYYKHENKKFELLFISSFFILLIIGRLPHISRGFIDGDESIWLTHALTLVKDPYFYISEVININTRFFCILPLTIIYPFGLNHSNCQFLAVIIFFINIIIMIRILNLYFDKKNIFISIIPIIYSISLLNTYGFIPYNSEHSSILILLLILYKVLNVVKNNKFKNIDLIYIGFLTFICIICKFQSLLIVTILNFYLLINFKKPKIILLLLLGFIIAYSPFILLAFIYDKLDFIFLYWADNLHYAFKGLGDGYKSTYINDILNIINIPDTKYFYATSFIVLLIIIFSKFIQFIYDKTFLFLSLLLLLSIYTVIKPQFLFLHYIFYILFFFFLFYSYCLNFIIKNKISYSTIAFIIIFTTLLPSFHILKSGNISFQLAKRNVDYFTNRNFIQSLVNSYLKEIENPTFAILGWNDGYYTEGNFLLGTALTFTTLFENEFPSKDKQYRLYIKQLNSRLPDLFCVQVGKNLNDYPELRDIIQNKYVFIERNKGDTFYLKNNHL